MSLNSNTTLHLKKAMIAALEKSLGIVTDACRSAGISRTTHYEWMKTDPEYKLEVESIEDIAHDFVESKLHEKIKGIEMGKVGLDGEVQTYSLPPSDTAIIFYLKTKAKKRGYIETNNTAEDKEIKITIERRD